MARGRFAERTKRGNVWLGVDISSTAIPGNTKVLLGSFDVVALAHRPFTIIRTYMQVLWTTDQLAAGETPVGAVGHIVVSDQAIGIGATAVPDPISQPDAEWHVWQGLVVDFQFGSAIGFQADAGHQYSVDSKAMRKVSNNQDVAFVGTSTSADGGIVTAVGRILVKLL